MSVFREVTQTIREIKAQREIRARDLALAEEAEALEEASSNALRAAEAAIVAGDYEAAEELLNDETKLSFEAGELRLQASKLRGER